MNQSLRRVTISEVGANFFEDFCPGDTLAVWRAGGSKDPRKRSVRFRLFHLKFHLRTDLFERLKYLPLVLIKLL